MGNNLTKVKQMKMARASKKEWQNLMDFANAYEELTPRFALYGPTDEELGALLRKFNPDFFRVVFGYATLVDNFCNLKSDTLEVRPDLAELMEKANFELTSGGFWD